MPEPLSGAGGSLFLRLLERAAHAKVLRRVVRVVLLVVALLVAFT